MPQFIWIEMGEGQIGILHQKKGKRIPLSDAALTKY